MRTTIVLAAALALGACARQQQLESGSDAGRIRSDRLVRYQCAGGLVINTFRRENGDIDVEWEGRRWALPKLQVGAPGIWTDGDLAFRELNGEAYLERRGVALARDCILWR